MPPEDDQNNLLQPTDQSIAVILLPGPAASNERPEPSKTVDLGKATSTKDGASPSSRGAVGLACGSRMSSEPHLTRGRPFQVYSESEVRSCSSLVVTTNSRCFVE